MATVETCHRKVTEVVFKVLTVASFVVRLASRTLFRAICSSIFSTIIEQAPFAIEDLMKELKAAEDSDSDSGQASEEDDEDEQLKKETSGKAAGRKGKQINGTKSAQKSESGLNFCSLAHK